MSEQREPYVVVREPVLLLSPYAVEIEANVAYAKACVLDSLRIGEAPFAPHLLYPQVLDDGAQEEREIGMAAGAAWLPLAVKVVVYLNRGWSPGMKQEIKRAQEIGKPVVYRFLTLAGVGVDAEIA